jgi:hypothetical protein
MDTYIFGDKKSQKIPKFNCENCLYNTCSKKDYTKHLQTIKHMSMSNTDAYLHNTSKNHATPYFCDCGKKYTHRQSLYTHKKKCTFIPETNDVISEENNDETNDENNHDENDQANHVIQVMNDNENHPNGQMDVLINLFQEQLKENKELKELIIEQQKKILEMGVGTTNIINTQNNNKFNLNVFLNETCKDALNLSDFLESLILSLTDFENFGPLGYCGGISNILVNGLNKLDISKRPIHCSDLKREVIHIKNNDTWHKDDDKQQMIKAIKAIEHKNVKQMSLWAKANPEYKDPNHKKSDLYTKLIDQSLCDSDKEKALKSYNKIIRTVAKEILVDK